MFNKKIRPLSKFASLLTLSLVLEPSVYAKTVDYSRVGVNIPYSSVTQLTHREADEKVSYGDDPLQYALLWNEKPLAENPSKKPLVILIHGGCWLNAFDIKHTFPLSTGLSQAGFDVWSLEYRRTGDKGGGWPGTFEDIKEGILAASKHNNQYSLENTIVIGHSAGGHLALLAGSEFKKLKGVIGLAAIADIEAYSHGTNSCQSVTKDFMQGSAEEQPEAYTLANPAKRNLHKNSLLLQGDADTIVPQSQALNSGLPTQVIKQAGHFDWIHPSSDAFNVLVQNLEAMSKE
ncbi:alpha/beta hydrolase [Alteromonadaceae bacterium M269]|nr:alpha/beta hydrolase [Alteromonadaceae bacterium M269]